MEDLLSIYIALVRSGLEYCCVVWHHALPSYLSNEVERVQKWAPRIILPDSSYEEALVHLGCLRLDERREQLCLNTLKRIEKGGLLSKYVAMTRGNTNDYDL